MGEQEEHFFDDNEADAEGAEPEEAEVEAWFEASIRELTPAEQTHARLKRRIRGEAAATRTTVDIPLLAPIMLAGAETHVLTLRRMRAGDILANNNRQKGKGQKGPPPQRDYVADAMWLGARLAEVSPNDLAQLDAADLDLMNAALAGFQNGRPAAP